MEGAEQKYETESHKPSDITVSIIEYLSRAFAENVAIAEMFIKNFDWNLLYLTVNPILKGKILFDPCEIIKFYSYFVTT